MWFQGLPIKLHAVPRMFRSYGIPVFQSQWFLYKALKAKSMNFQVGGVGDGPQEVHMQVVHAMGSDRQIVCLGQMRDLQCSLSACTARVGLCSKQGYSTLLVTKREKIRS
jgi:hypothetical protein